MTSIPTISLSMTEAWLTTALAQKRPLWGLLATSSVQYTHLQLNHLASTVNSHGDWRLKDTQFHAIITMLGLFCTNLVEFGVVFCTSQLNR